MVADTLAEILSFVEFLPSAARAALFMDLQLSGLRVRVLVTAGAGGIRLEIVRAFLPEGANVHVCEARFLNERPVWGAASSNGNSEVGRKVDVHELRDS